MREQKIYEDINQLSYSILQKRNSGDIKKFFDFMKKNPHHAPFNNALVFTQKPDCVYYMTANQWESKFKRSTRQGARPMVILFPFGPIKLVYDFEDTEGEDELDKNSFVSWWKEEKSNILSPEIFEKTIRHIDKKYQIPLIYKNAKDYFSDNSLTTGGFANGLFEITLNPKYNPVTNSNIDEAYGVLVHEIAHIFLGHLGQKEYHVIKKEEGVLRLLCEDRSYINRSVAELEAELTAWLVFIRFGIEKKSVDYMATWLSNEKDWQNIDFSRVLRTANTIFEMK